MIFPSVRKQEKERFFFFFILTLLLTMGQTLGLIGSETLILSVLGADVLPEAFVFASLTTVLLSLIYAFGVNISRNDNYFIRILILFALALSGCSLALASTPHPPTIVLIVLYCLYYASFAICTNHFWTFTGDFFDTLSSKRLFPLFSVGSSLGGLIGGILASILTKLSSGPGVLIWTWILSSLGAALWLWSHKGELRRWGPLEIEEADETSFEGLQSSIRYLRNSRLGRLLVLSSIFMVTSLFISQYLYSTIFVTTYPDPGKLAIFFGAFLACANALELVLELKITPLLLRQTGVANSNLAHAALTALSFLLLILAPNLYSAILARLNRETIDNSLGSPVRNLVYNALPSRLRGRIRAFLEGIVVYSGMASAGIILILWENLRPHSQSIDTTLCGIGLILSVGFLVTNYEVKKDYVEALVAGIRMGRIDLFNSSSALEALPTQRLQELWTALIEQDSQVQVLEEVCDALASRNLTEPLEYAFLHGSDRVRQVSLQALLACPSINTKRILDLAIVDENPKIRLHALSYSSETSAQYSLKLLNDCNPDVRAEAAIRCTPISEQTLTSMLESSDSAFITAALIRLPFKLVSYAEQGLKSDEACQVRASLITLSRLKKTPSLGELESLFKSAEAEVCIEILNIIACQAQPLDTAEVNLFYDALANQNRQLRRAAISILSPLGSSIRTHLETAASSHKLYLAEGAIEVLGRLPQEETHDFIVQESIKRARRAWMHSLEAAELEQQGAADYEEGKLSQKFLILALKDSVERDLAVYFRLLEVLEEPKIVRSVEKVLRFARARIRADALEVLSNLGAREASALLVHLLEDGSPIDQELSASTMAPPRRNKQAMLAQLRSTGDRWLELAASLHSAGETGASPGGTRSKIEQATFVEHLLMLQKIPLFSGMTLDQLDAIHRCLCEQQYTLGEFIFAEGDIGDEMFIVLEGEVEILIKVDSEQPLLLSTVGAGSYFGEMSILDNEPRSAAARVSKDVRLLALKGEQLKELIYAMPELAFTIFKVLSERQRRSDKRLNELSQEQKSALAAR